MAQNRLTVEQWYEQYVVPNYGLEPVPRIKNEIRACGNRQNRRQRPAAGLPFDILAKFPHPGDSVEILPFGVADSMTA
jgi:hypothetical protein